MQPWLLVVCALAGCGRLGFEATRPVACLTGADCESGFCADGVCCASACDGTCDSCASGTCVPVPGSCSGDCARCTSAGGGFSCAAEAAACGTGCGTATCNGSGTTFTCDLSGTSCCSTSTAPNFTGQCSTAKAVVVPSGCQLEYDHGSCCTGVNYVEVTWDVQACQNGVWVAVDSGADAFPCGSNCTPRMTDSWSDTCGNASGTSMTCP